MAYRNKTYVCFDGDNDIHYFDHQIDLVEIGKFLDPVCRYTEINSMHNGTGTPI